MSRKKMTLGRELIYWYWPKGLPCYSNEQCKQYDIGII